MQTGLCWVSHRSPERLHLCCLLVSPPGLFGTKDLRDDSPKVRWAGALRQRQSIRYEQSPQSSNTAAQAECRGNATRGRCDTGASAPGFHIQINAFLYRDTGDEIKRRPCCTHGQLPHSACADGLQSAPDQPLSRPSPVITTLPPPSSVCGRRGKPGCRKVETKSPKSSLPQGL